MQQGTPRVDVRLGGQKVFIMPVSGSEAANLAPTSPHRGLDHFGLTVTDIDSVYAELKGRGAKFSQDIHTQRPGITVMSLRGRKAFLLSCLSVARNTGSWTKAVVKQVLSLGPLLARGGQAC